MRVMVEIRKNTYYDSVALMLVTREIKKMPGVAEVLVGMGTALNKELAVNLNLSDGRLEEITPNDLFIAVRSDDVEIERIVSKADALLNSRQAEERNGTAANSLDAAVKILDGANLAVISLPGMYAAAEANKALQDGLHVMLFSDNVSVEEEIELKRMGREKGLLVMGPDCGTAIINHVPLCFANAVRKGDIGIIGASGTGMQEVTVQIQRLGGGISQAIGTGGRDLSAAVGGIMMLEGLKALKDDPETKVIVLISKPPAPEAAKAVLTEAARAGKPVVVDFIGGDSQLITRYGLYAGMSLEDAAQKAVQLSKGMTPEDFEGFTQPEETINALAKAEASKFNIRQRYARALYTGGTLADEAMKILDTCGLSFHSNIPLREELRLKDIMQSEEHTCIDLGDDAFTTGKPHPMIDPAERIARMQKEALDGETAIILLDFVLGYGAHPDPAGEMLSVILQAKEEANKRGETLCVIGYVCGTEGDPQNYPIQRKKLEEAGVILMPSNAQAARLTAKILNEIRGKAI